jgi:uncharacterized protein YkwD
VNLFRRPSGHARRSATLILVIAFASSCHTSRGPAPGAPLPQDTARPRVSAANVERMVHRLVNAERERSGLAPLAWDEALARIARGHSQDMSRRRYFSHDTPEGHDLAFRYAQEGYRCAIRVGNVRFIGAENILQNNLYDSVVVVNGKAAYSWNSEERIAETTVRGWMDSPGHRRNILTPHWGKEGIGVFIDPDGKIYITQNFC